ncbi:MAG: hypothetical protein ACXWZE_22425 [Candidatus Binatia bacterium]
MQRLVWATGVRKSWALLFAALVNCFVYMLRRQIHCECEGPKKISPAGRNDNDSELSVFAPLREKYPNSKVFGSEEVGSLHS